MTKATDVVHQTTKAKDDWKPGIPSSLLFCSYWGRSEDFQLLGLQGSFAPTTLDKNESLLARGLRCAQPLLSAFALTGS